MGMATSEHIYHTADMVRELNAAEPRHWPRYECVYGELLVSPAPRDWHQLVAQRVLIALTTYVERAHRDALVYMAPADVSFGRDDVVVQPDVFVVSRVEARAGLRGEGWKAISGLLLAVEVLSQGTRRADRFSKRQLYQRQGVPLYWVVDPETRTAEVWTPDAHFPAIERETLVWHPAGALEPFTSDLAALFAALFAEP